MHNMAHIGGDRKIIRYAELIMMKADDNVLWLPDSYYDRSSLASQAPQLIHTPAASASDSSLSTLLNGNFYSQPRVCLILSTKVRRPRQRRAKSGKVVIRSGTVWAQDETVTATWGSRRSVYTLLFCLVIIFTYKKTVITPPFWCNSEGTVSKHYTLTFKTY